ncbi:histidine phosphatase family protein [Streptomyces sp. H27-H1]|uniref:histidine phosphatase family protein n=1 Tax=unclassified Streptomyces TaxID=2593676 RepID=UPI002271D40A|nr:MULTISPECIES: histidine phosphatase family protein [unclassified Streptomyces]MCY0929452.1 histidine phosphatase family protein [Streptomyces sp. H27-H1]MCY0938332.1 histidine phosphatase family protein [Streptomyces sp. H34-S4]
MTITTRLVLTRHGEAHCNVNGRVGGEKTCTGLTDRGRRQVERLAARLAAEHRTGPAFDVLYAGPRLRLQESGQILATALGLPLITDPGLDGPRHGQADGRLWRDIEADFRGHPSAHPDLPYAQGSDTWNGYLLRAGLDLSALLQRHHGQNILIAGHGETVHAACHLLLELTPHSSSRVAFGTDHACLTRLELQRDPYDRLIWNLTALNDTAHLKDPTS